MKLLGPVDQVPVDLLERLVVVARQLDALPQLVGKVRSLHRLHVQVAHALFLAHRRVLAVRQWTRGPIAQTCQVVLVAAKLLRFCSVSTSKQTSC